MSRAKRSAVFVFFGLASASLLGCLHRPGPRSDYALFYRNRLAGIRVPTYEEIASPEDSLVEVFDQPAPKVWDACLGFAAQSRGVLAVANDASGAHRLLLIDGETVGYRLMQAPDQQVFVDRWMAVGLRPLSEGSTEVRVAFVSPKTGQVAPFYTDRPSGGFKGDKSLSVSRRTAEVFIMGLRKTFLEDEYLARFGGAFHLTSRGVPRAIETESTEGGDSVARQRGNYKSATIRRERLVLNMPRLEKRIAGVIHDFSKVANQDQQDTEVFIIAADSPSFQIEPNGDLFVTTGALDQIQDTGELTGVLSHELAHFYLHHGSMREGAFRDAEISKTAIAVTFVVGGGVYNILSQIPKSAAPKDTLFTNKQVFTGAAVALGIYYLSGQLGTGIGKGVGDLTIHGFTRKQELEADEYGAELLWAAGYDYRGLLRLLKREGDNPFFTTKREVRQ